MIGLAAFLRMGRRRVRQIGDDVKLKNIEFFGVDQPALAQMQV
jgi:hypothetical protein